jgi:uncharacterized protein (DUF1499 family)
MSLIWAALIYPINDITTTPDLPPAYIEIAKLDAHKGADLTYDSALKSRQVSLYPDLVPLPRDQSAAKVFLDVTKAVEKMENWKVINVDDANLRIEVTVTSKLLKFVDDVVIEVRPEGAKSSVHMRSKSRLGRSDLGANYKRIQEFFALLR